MKKYIVFKLILVLFFFIPKTTYAQNPELTATGNQIYCGNSINITQSVNITDSSATTTDASVYIQIATNYEDGEDLLTLLGTHPTISSTWSDQEGKLTLSPSTPGGTVSYAELEAAILDVEFNTSSTTSGEKLFTILLGVGNRELSYLPRNGHYYEYVSNLGITWTAARVLAETYFYRGLQGYLVTLTAEDEQQIAGIQAPGAGWIGATDETIEGDWRWVTGPEGAANGGTGTLFWTGTGCIGCGSEVATPDGLFSFWNNNNAEPNAANPGEDYAHIVSPNLIGARAGTWNDMPVGGTISGVYQPKGFIIEYGGMLGDTPEAPILATTSIIIPDIIYYPKRSATICPLGTATFTGVPTNLPTSTEVYWYDDPTSATPIWTGLSFETPQLSTTTTFYSDNGCLSQRKSFTVTVNTVPDLTVSPAAYTYDQNDVATQFNVTPSAGYTLKWYNAAGDIIATSPNPTPSTDVVGVTSYFVSQINTASGCEGSKIEITVTVNGVPVAPNPPVVSNISYCQNETALALTATASLNCTLNWYTTISGGTSTAASPTPSTTTLGITSYFVSQTDNSSGLESTRAEIQVTINPTPTIVITNPAIACSPTTVDLTAASVTVGSTLEGGILSYWTDAGATTALSNPNAIAVSGTYYIKAETSSGCMDIKPVTVTVSDQPVLVITNPAAVCSPITVDLTADSVTTGSTLEGGVLSYWTDAAATAVLSNPNAVTTSGTYYIKVETTAGCVDIEAVTITINPSPTLVITDPAGACLPSTVDLTANSVSSGSTLEGGILSYWTDAVATTALSNPNAVAVSGTYYIKAETSSGCMDIKPVTVTVSNQPVLVITNPAAVCSPITVDLTAATVTTGSTLEGGVLSYWADAAAATVLSNPNAVTTSGTYYIKVETTVGCIDIKPVTVTINPLPNIDLNLDGSADEIVCSDNTTFSFTLDAGIQDNTPTSDYSYIWSKDGSVLSDITPTLDVSDIGVYTVDVINNFGCSQIRTINIKTAKNPIIDTIEIVGLSTNNSVTVILEEPGDFQYTIDNPNGFWQDSNVFSNVSGGEYTVYVRDKFGCLGDSRVIVVISVPTFFTPNNDSDNDYWNVKGLNKDDSKSIVYIFDRYGKLLKQWIPSIELGWDGTYNGAPLPSNDYWYVLKMENGRVAKGHFSLIR